MPTNRLVHGIAINDADYPTQPRINGKQHCCPYYRRWKHVVQRVYCPKFKKKNPAYIGVSMCGEWLYFSKFKQWMEGQQWEGKELDKDIILPGNKMYSPETCCFVPKSLNCLLSQRKSNKGKYPTGVTDDKIRGNRYLARIVIESKSVQIGWFKTPAEASNAYLKMKAELVLYYSVKESDPRIKAGLRLHAELFKSMVEVCPL